jgi:hypothetical protein
VCFQLLEAASIFEICDLSCIELLERLERVERAGPSSDLIEYFHTFADAGKDQNERVDLKGRKPPSIVGRGYSRPKLPIF